MASMTSTRWSCSMSLKSVEFCKASRMIACADSFFGMTVFTKCSSNAVASASAMAWGRAARFSRPSCDLRRDSRRPSSGRA